MNCDWGKMGAKGIQEWQAKVEGVPKRVIESGPPPGVLKIKGYATEKHGAPFFQGGFQ